VSCIHKAVGQGDAEGLQDRGVAALLRGAFCRLTMTFAGYTIHKDESRHAQRGDVMDTLKQEYAYYLANKAEFDRKYSGKAVVIKNNAIIGVYPSRAEAVQKTQPEHEPGTFLVQLCGPEGEKPLVFHSRVAFS